MPCVSTHGVIALRCLIALTLLSAGWAGERPALAQEPQVVTRSSRVAEEAFNVRAVTYNIRYNNPGDGENAWPHRKDWVGELLMAKQADVIGLQEVLHEQYKDLAERLDGYESRFVGRDRGDERGEGCPIFFRSERFEAIGYETLWLSETPTQAGSRGWDAALPRIVTHLKLRERQTDRILHVFNTHFDHQGEEARRNSAKLIHDLIRDKAGAEPWVAMGDLNALPESVVLGNLLGAENEPPTFVDAREVATEVVGPDSTWNGFREVLAERRIDFIVVADDVRVSRLVIDDQSREGRFPSDHLSVEADLVFSTSN